MLVRIGCWVTAALFFQTVWAQVSIEELSRVPFVSFGPDVHEGSDVWGFTDAKGREYAMMGADRGTGFFDITDPRAPRLVGFIEGRNSIWRDIKTFVSNASPESFQAYAYIVEDQADFEFQGDGLQIVDLSNLPDEVRLVGSYHGHGLETAHNIFIPLEPVTPHAYVLGANIAAGGVVVLNLADPLNPVQVGTWQEFYVHDFYLSSHWADPSFDGREMGVAFCGWDNISIIDFTDKSNPTTIDSYTYPDIRYAHSGWVSKDGRYIFACDELDESAANKTRIRVIDILDMRNPKLAGVWEGPTSARDHNAFVKGDRLHLANYSRGYTLLDISNPIVPLAVGNLDTYPSNDNTSYNGAWGCFPYFESGVVAVSDVQSGLILLKPGDAPIQWADFLQSVSQWPGETTVLDLTAMIQQIGI